jgi:xanthine dehydrogenase YagR molybdenum-binding subunit
VTYRKEKPNVATELQSDDDPEAVLATSEVILATFGPQNRLESQRGDAKAAFAAAPVKIDQTYVTPAETHNVIELHATTAMWESPSNLTLYDSTQGVVNLRSVLAQMFGLPKENVRVISKFLGSGFGGKLFPWTHCALAAAAARKLGKPVKLVLSRKMMFQTVGHRPRTQQRVQLGATRDGKLVSFQHDYVYQRSILDYHHEDCGEATAYQYSVPNLRVTFGRAKRNIGATCDMRGPGAVPGLYATESAMNELAYQLKIDPVKLRIINEPKIDEGVFYFHRGIARVPRAGWSVWVVEAHPKLLDEARRANARLGNGRSSWIGRGFAAAMWNYGRWHGACRLRHAGHRHRHIHDPRAAHFAEDRRAARKG